MENTERNAIQSISNKLGIENAEELLSTRLTLSELNTLLLEVFRNMTDASTPNDLLKRYETNRFVRPAAIDPLQLKKLELSTLEIARSFHYTPIQLSPVAPLGSCSIVATADQNKIISALRGTEVVADATNLLTLHICDLIKSGELSNDADSIRFSTTHRHVRAQQFYKPGLVPHFHLFCMVASGKDKGSYSFEKQTLLEHIKVYQHIFSSFFDTNIRVSLNSRCGYTDPDGFMRRIIEFLKEQLPEIDIFENTNKSDNQYYKGLQFSIFVTINGRELNIGDGGFVDWTQKLLNNKKERLLISAIGLDRLLSLN